MSSKVKKGKVDRSIFDGSTINTPSMLCVEDYIDALQWCDTVGGLNGLIKRSEVKRRSCLEPIKTSLSTLSTPIENIRRNV